MTIPARQILCCELSPCRRYRYQLAIDLLADRPTKRALTVILKNPSRADATRGDPTTGKVEAWARQHSFATVTYLNLFALRSPHPKTINQVAYADAVGGHNDATLTQLLGKVETLVLAWGNPNGIEATRYQQRIGEVLALIAQATTSPLSMIGDLTQLGYPRHGLQWRKEMAIEKLGD